MIDSSARKNVETKKYNGYLSFLPPSDTISQEESPLTIHIDQASQNHYRKYHNRDFCWFEFKHALTDQPYPFKIETKDNYLWILIQLLGSGKIEITPTLYVKDGIVYCYYAPNRTKALSLDPGKNWFFLLGIAEHHWPDLAAEYPLLQDIGKLETTDGMEHKQLVGQTAIQAKLMAALDSLRRFEFRSFSLSFRLAAWNLRLFNLVFQELKAPEKPQEDTLITLYHKATNYIRENFREEELCVKMIANAMHVSVRKLYSSFENRRFSVMGYVQELRLVLARNILTDSQETIASIAFVCHFSSDKHFSRLFKKRFGKGPNEYRIAIQGNISFKYKR
ncbi:helix-turn-helix transcriptional regulator [Sphingobacterium sp. DN00404]|uniref:Helix-turn-helix transcriptional regulator n=1 Tax=Sphingobacterium micropteri TaxID=2763501 RepID=A0ABR7YMS2_9SPHI|nr:AraC family transcriptional regulator [Sphingobacterium micropteri]MBD1432630.1 helix-turn-helix transcriptional regulator [Sphingobacterium micropteri]